MELHTNSHSNGLPGGYSLKNLLGRGTITEVYRVFPPEKQLHASLIMTVLLVSQMFTEQARHRFTNRFSREAERLVAFHHPHLLSLVGYGFQETYPYLLTADVEGELLALRLQRQKYWQLTEVLSIIQPIASALDYLHSKSFVFQFFSPANVLIQADSSICLVGTGLSQIVRMHGLDETSASPYTHLHTIAGTYLGTPEYLAPEVIQGREADSRSDIYSLGILLFELLCGKPPFTGNSYLEIVKKHIEEPLPSLHATRPDVPRAMEIVVNHALHRNPERRFRQASDLVVAFQQVLDKSRRAASWASQHNITERIQRLPSVAPLITLQTPSIIPEHHPLPTSWPYSLLTDLRKIRSGALPDVETASSQPNAFTAAMQHLMPPKLPQSDAVTSCQPSLTHLQGITDIPSEAAVPIESEPSKPMLTVAHMVQQLHTAHERLESHVAKYYHQQVSQDEIQSQDIARYTSRRTVHDKE